MIGLEGVMFRKMNKKDLALIMQNLGLFEARSRGCQYTWTNKTTMNPIYSKIDKKIGDVDWFQKYNSSMVEILTPRISDHAHIKVGITKQMQHMKTLFKFMNCVTQDNTYSHLFRSWHDDVRGPSMYKLWTNLRRLKPIQGLE